MLAYSGGLDTSVAIRWLNDKGWDVIAFTVDLGEKKDLDTIQQRALKTGASAAYVADGREAFLNLFVWPSLQAGAIYEKQYPLATALGRPLIAAMLVQVARREGATAIAHGCTGKGNDQVRFDVAAAALAPELEVVAPVREWGMNRDDEIEYAQKHGIEVPATVRSPYSTDENLWGRSIEAGVLEDPWAEPPADVYAWTADPRECPDEPAYVEIGFKSGIPSMLDGRPAGPLELVTALNRLGGRHGVGRIDHLENRLIGIKSREIYEAPAAGPRWCTTACGSARFGTRFTPSSLRPRLTLTVRCGSSSSRVRHRWSVAKARRSCTSCPSPPTEKVTRSTRARPRASSSFGVWACAPLHRCRDACMRRTCSICSET